MKLDAVAHCPTLSRTGSYAIVQLNHAGAEPTRLEELEIVSYAGSERRLSAAEDHWTDKQVTFVKQIGFEREPRKLGAADIHIMRRVPLELSNSLDVKVPLDTRIACASACQRS